MRVLSQKTASFIVFTLVIGGSFYFGMLFYPFSSSKEITHTAVKVMRPQLEQNLQKGLLLDTGKSTIRLTEAELRSWTEIYHRRFSGKEDLRLSQEKISAYLEPLSPGLNSEPVNAKLTFQNDKADVFVPSVNGKHLNITDSAGLISNAILEGKPSVSLSFDVIEPDITLEKINNLGINTLLAKGESDYGNSSASRIYNIKTGMRKFNGIILKPGEEFSFNTLLGGVEESDGYRAELVIKNGQLVREYGGGLCQVSTTVFRAAIMAGFPITERKPHSFPVQYYNPQGFDSTIYPGVVDLKFINNTPSHTLIQTKVTGSRLSVEIYGSSDGRKVAMEGPVQYDKKPSGAMKAYFTRKIYNGEELVKEERFDSVYKDPPASPLEKNPLE